MTDRDRECDCPPGWRHEPTCPEVTGIRPRMHQQLDDPVRVRDDMRAADQHDIQVRLK